jgi:hypothetical protein
MKPGRKKIEKDKALSGKPEPAEAGSKKTGDDDSGTFSVASGMIGSNPDGIDSVRVLQVITISIAIIELIWLGLRYILHAI